MKSEVLANVRRSMSRSPTRAEQEFHLPKTMVKIFEGAPASRPPPPEKNPTTDDLIINWDQTGVRLVPNSDWTMAAVGSRHLEVRGLGDKRGITALQTITLSGKLLPPHLLYPGKFHHCHPHLQFPRDWDVHHSDNH